MTTQTLGIAGAYNAVIAQLLSKTPLKLSRSAIAKDRPAVADMRQKFSVDIPGGGANIDRGNTFMAPQRVEVWFVWPLAGGNQATAKADAYDMERQVILALHERQWHDLPVESWEYVASVRQTSPDGELYKVGITGTMMVQWDLS